MQKVGNIDIFVFMFENKMDREIPSLQLQFQALRQM